MKQPRLMACHECDLLQRIGPMEVGQTALCRRCGAVLYTHKPGSFDRSLALTLAGLILFGVANAYPLLEIKSGSLYQASTLMGSVLTLFDGGNWPIGVVVFLTAFLFPLLELTCMLFILVPLRMTKKPWRLPSMLTFIQSIRPWGMMEVFMLGILVSVVKLIKMVKVIPGLSLYAFAVLIFVLAAVATSFDYHHAWGTVHGDDK